MENQIVEIDREVERLRKLREKIVLLTKLEMRKNKGRNGKANVLIRVSKDFNCEIEDILKKRIENGIDKDFTSRPRIVDLITRHKQWPIIKEDLIHYNFGGELNE